MAVQIFTPAAFVANTGLPMWSARMKYTTLPALAGVLGRSAGKRSTGAFSCPPHPSITATGFHPFQTYSRMSAPEVSLYSAIRRPSLSKTEWIVTGVGEVRVR